MRTQSVGIYLLAFASGVCAQETYSAKSLFFGEDNNVVAVSTTQNNKISTAVATKQNGIKKPPNQLAGKNSSQTKDIGLSYFIRLQNKDGSYSEVLTSRKFKSGERFQIALKVNRPSYIYVLNESDSGKVVQIYPQPGVDNFINAMGSVILPGKGTFEFDQEPGIEQLLVYVSETPLTHGIIERVKQMRPDMETAKSAPVKTGESCEQMANETQGAEISANMQLASAGSYASKGIAYIKEEQCSTEAPKTGSYASKGIIFSDDTNTNTNFRQSASYVVKNIVNSDASLFLKIKLHHQ